MRRHRSHTRTGERLQQESVPYLKALAAFDNGVPFYVALPASRSTGTLADGVAEIPLKARSPDEVTCISGLSQRTH